MASFALHKSAIIVALVGMAASLLVATSAATQVGAVDLNDACRNAGSSSAPSSFCEGRGENISNGFAQDLTNLLLFALGTIAVIMIVLGGIKYATSNGDASKIASAKNTILYSVVGLIVAVMAWGIVSFVVRQFS